MINIFLFIAIVLILTFIFGRLFEKIKVPWIFAALVFGAISAGFRYIEPITQSDTFGFIAKLGMYFFLFIIGFDINIKEMKKQGKFLFKATFFITTLAAVMGGVVFYYFFGYSWFVSLLIGFSFATVGEAVLIPIIDEFKITNTKLGQAVIGIGVLDDIIEIAVLIIVVGLVGNSAAGSINIELILISLGILFLLTFGFTKLRKEGVKFSFINLETMFLFSLGVLFLFLGIGEYSEAAPLAAFLAGISLRTFIPKERIKLIESEMRAMAYGLFAPIFFFWVGSSMDLGVLSSAPVLLLIVLIVSILAKIIGSFIISKGYLTSREAFALGVGLSVRFSTSIVIIKIFFDSGIINSELYSILIASSIILTFIVPVVFSWIVRGMKKK